MSTLYSQRGFGVVEVAVVMAVIAVVFVSIYQFAVAMTASVHAGAREVEAAYSAQEGIEAVRMVRDYGWTDTIAPLSLGAPYYLELSPGADRWLLTASD